MDFAKGLIIGAGEILDYGAVRKAIPQGAFVICADGGYRHCEILNLIPDLIIGDFDSICANPPPGIPHITLPTDKDYTDSFFAVEKALELGCNTLMLTGMLGGRLDHTLANLQTLARCTSLGINAYITDGLTIIYSLHSSDDTGKVLMLNHEPGHYFSVFSVNGACASVSIDGTVYPLDNYPLSSLDPRAVSNEFGGNEVKITVKQGTVIVVVTKKYSNQA